MAAPPSDSSARDVHDPDPNEPVASRDDFARDEIRSSQESSSTTGETSPIDRSGTPSTTADAPPAPTLGDVLTAGLSRKDARALAGHLAEAVAGLHARRGIHGELRPETILVVADGSVEFLAPADLESTTSADLERNERSTLTVEGLAYASPERARRIELGPEAEVFAVGLLLQEILSGSPGRAARLPAGELFAAALAGSSMPVRDLEGELADLIERAKDPDPRRRPAAIELLAELRRPVQPLIGPRTLALGAACLAILALLVGAMRRTASARETTDSRIVDAEKALEGFFKGVQPELERPDELDVLAKAGRDALRSLDSALLTDPSAEAEVLHAEALLWNGTVLRAQGETEEATSLLERAAMEAERLSNTIAGQHVALEAHVALGELAKAALDFDVASTSFGRAIEIGGALGDEVGSDPRVALALARALRHRGEIAVASGRGLDAELDFKAARDALMRESQARLDEASVLTLAAELDLLEAGIHLKRNDELEAIALLEGHCTKLRRVVELDPIEPRRRMMLARGSSLLGALQADRGNLHDAEARLREALDGWRVLLGLVPNQPDWRRERALSLHRLATVLDGLGREDAGNYHRVGIAEAEDLLREGGTVAPGARLQLAVQRADFARHLLGTGVPSEAGAEASAALALLGSGPDHPRNKDRWRKLDVHVRVLIAESSLASRRPTAADEAAGRVLESLASLATVGLDADLRAEEARALLVRGAACALRGDLATATRAREQAHAIATELIGKSDDPAHRALRAAASMDLGRLDETADDLAVLDAQGYRPRRLDYIRAWVEAR